MSLAPRSFLDYKDRLIKSISDNFRESVRSGSTASVHDLRVGIKRLRSLLQILADYDAWFKEQNFAGTFRRLFKAAGRVRDLHVAEELFWKWASGNSQNVSEYYNFLKNKEISARQRYLATAKNFNTGKFGELSREISRRFQHYVPRYLEQAVGRNSAGALLRIAVRKTGSPLGQDELHALRIAAKDARYRLLVLSEMGNANNFMKDTDSWLRSLHQAIGLWHDTIIAASRLHSFLSSEAVYPLFSPASYEALALELQKQQDEAHSRITEVWRDQGGVLKKSIELLQPYNV